MERKEEMCSMRTPSDRYNEKKGSEWASHSVRVNRSKQSERAYTLQWAIYIFLSLSKPSIETTVSFLSSND